MTKACGVVCGLMESQKEKMQLVDLAERVLKSGSEVPEERKDVRGVGTGGPTWSSTKYSVIRIAYTHCTTSWY